MGFEQITPSQPTLPQSLPVARCPFNPKQQRALQQINVTPQFKFTISYCLRHLHHYAQGRGLESHRRTPIKFFIIGAWESTEYTVLRNLRWEGQEIPNLQEPN